MADDKPAQGYESPRLFTETEVREIAREEARKALSEAEKAAIRTLRPSAAFDRAASMRFR